MTAECERAAPAETGGVLMGYRTDGTDERVATHVIGPGPAAIHEECRFVPDHDYQLAEITRLYEMSGRRLEYLGDWHSHPGAEGYLSDKDLETLNRIAQSRTARVEKPVMLVMAGRGGWAAFAWIHERPSAWVWGRRSIIQPLAVELFD
jgi:integrative and conjugative element protein (TIGR02256 family)